MSASVENGQNLITYLPLSCNSSLSGLLAEVTVLSSSLKLSTACAHDGKSAMLNLFVKQGQTLLHWHSYVSYLWLHEVLVRPEECNSSLFPNRKAGCFSLGTLAGSIALHSATASSATLGASGETVQTETASCRPLEWIKPSLENTTARKSSFVIQWWQPLNISFVELRLENSLKKVVLLPDF